MYISGPLGKAAAPECRLFLELEVLSAQQCTSTFIIVHPVSTCLIVNTVAVSMKFSAHNCNKLKRPCKQKQSHALCVTPLGRQWITGCSSQMQFGERKRMEECEFQTRCCLHFRAFYCTGSQALPTALCYISAIHTCVFQ